MTYRQKLFLLTLLPMILISAVILFVVNLQAERLATAQRTEIETLMLDLKKEEIKNYITLAENAIGPLYNSRLKTRRQAQREAAEIVRKMSFGEDNYYFIYDGDGQSIMHPRLSYLVGRNWIGLKDKEGREVIRDLINNAKDGGDFYSYVWQKPSSKDYVQKLAYSTFFPHWNWMLGTGVYLDDLQSQVAQVNAQFQNNIAQTRLALFIISVAAIAATAAVLFAFQISEQRLADARLKQLTKRIVDVQEEERKRVSHDLHDSISQLLVSCKYGLESALAEKGDVAKPIEASLAAMDTAISEVRRISTALRPTALDDMGLAAAINSLGAEFQTATGIDVTTRTEQVRNLLNEEAKTALYRIVQEALTNIAKHAQASVVDIELRQHKKTISLSIKDNGIGADIELATGGLGLRNMTERIESLGAKIEFTSAPAQKGFRINVTVPVEKDITKRSV